MWTRVADKPAPKDRLILVTNGWAWYREINDAVCCWGKVFLVYWHEGNFVDASKNLVPMFDYWCDVDNPFSKEGIFTAAQIPSSDDRNLTGYCE